MKRRSLPWPSLSRGIPFAIYVAMAVLHSWLASTFPAVDLRWLYALRITAVAIALILLRRHYIELGSTQQSLRPGTTHPLLAILIGCVIFLLWIELDIPWLTMGQPTGFDPRTTDGNLDWPLALARLAGTALVVPVMEELFWRSWIMRRIDCSTYWTYSPKAVTLTALVLSSLVFGLEHRLWFAGFLAGLGYGSLYRYSENVRTPVIAHAITNLLLGIWVLTTGNWQFW